MKILNTERINGYGRYAVLDIDEYKDKKKMLAWQKLK
jgi:hypothetical protein